MSNCSRWCRVLQNMMTPASKVSNVESAARASTVDELNAQQLLSCLFLSITNKVQDPPNRVGSLPLGPRTSPVSGLIACEAEDSRDESQHDTALACHVVAQA
jgi:hypothetical protein